MGWVHELVDGLCVVYRLDAKILQQSAGFREISKVERDICPGFRRI